MLGRFQLDGHGLSDIGRRRKRNEDQFLIAELQKSMLIAETSLSHEERTRLFGRTQGHLLVVADGMGGAAAGDRASRIAVRVVIRYLLDTMHWFFRLDEQRPEDLREELIAALGACQRNIECVAESRPEIAGMGTTLTLAYVLWPRAYVVHAGDSRCYLFRRGELEQVTTDHTIAQRMIEQGTLPRDAPSRWSHVLWNVVGGGTPDLRPEVHKVEVQVGDVLLLCTDGLHQHVADEAITRILTLSLPADETCRRLVDAANDAGGSDNITVIVARYNPPGTAPERVGALSVEAPRSQDASDRDLDRGSTCSSF